MWQAARRARTAVHIAHWQGEHRATLDERQRAGEHQRGRGAVEVVVSQRQCVDAACVLASDYPQRA